MAGIKAELKIILEETGNISKEFEEASEIVVKESLKNAVIYSKKRFEEKEKIIKKTYNIIVKKYPDMMLKFRNYLNTFEKIKEMFYNDLDRNSFNKTIIEAYSTSFEKLAKGFEQEFKEELYKTIN